MSAKTCFRQFYYSFILGIMINEDNRDENMFVKITLSWVCLRVWHVTAVKLGQAHTLLSINLLFFFIWGVHLYICAFVYLCCVGSCSTFLYLLTHSAAAVKVSLTKTRFFLLHLYYKVSVIVQSSICDLWKGEHLRIFCTVTFWTGP